jgi:hypothetical protein
VGRRKNEVLGEMWRTKKFKRKLRAAIAGKINLIFLCKKSRNGNNK